MDEIRDIFSEIGLASVFLVGGEIFVRKDIYEIIELFNTRVAHVSLLTNGTLIDREGSEKLKSFKNVRDVWFSVDGPEQIHDAIRGAGSFQRVMRVIGELRGHKNIFINTVILKENIGHLMEMYRFFDAMGIEQVTFQFQIIYSGEQYKKTCEALSSDSSGMYMYNDCVQELVELEYVSELKEMIPRLLEQQNKTRIRFYPELFVGNLDEYMDGTIRKRHRLACSDIMEPRLKIGPSGELLLCEAMSFSPGNLNQVRLDELWNCESMKGCRKKVSQSNLFDLCSRCCSVGLRK